MKSCLALDGKSLLFSFKLDKEDDNSVTSSIKTLVSTGLSEIST